GVGSRDLNCEIGLGRSSYGCDKTKLERKAHIAQLVHAVDVKFHTTYLHVVGCEGFYQDGLAFLHDAGGWTRHEKAGGERNVGRHALVVEGEIVNHLKPGSAICDEGDA